jgi:hypothetical protein
MNKRQGEKGDDDLFTLVGDHRTCVRSVSHSRGAAVKRLHIAIRVLPIRICLDDCGDNLPCGVLWNQRPHTSKRGAFLDADRLGRVGNLSFEGVSAWALI